MVSPLRSFFIKFSCALIFVGKSFLLTLICDTHFESFTTLYAFLLYFKWSTSRITILWMSVCIPLLYGIITVTSFPENAFTIQTIVFAGEISLMLFFLMMQEISKRFSCGTEVLSSSFMFLCDLLVLEIRKIVVNFN